MVAHLRDDGEESQPAECGGLLNQPDHAGRDILGVCQEPARGIQCRK